MSPCPGDDQLRLLLDEQLADDVAGALARHTDQCPACQQRLEHLIRDFQAIVDRANAGSALGEEKSPPSRSAAPRTPCSFRSAPPLATAMQASGKKAAAAEAAALGEGHASGQVARKC
jgi:anti-sigma factor RsiW